MGIGEITQGAAADAHHHRPVSQHKRFKGRLGRRVPPGGEALQQLPVC